MTSGKCLLPQGTNGIWDALCGILCPEPMFHEEQLPYADLLAEIHKCL